MRHATPALAVLTLLVGLTAGPAGAADGPSFDCAKVEDGSIAKLVCDDPGLSAQDRTLASVYAAASKIAVTQKPNTLKAEQRGWVKGRDDCWKETDKRACVAEAYTRRIAELQARYRLVDHKGPVFLACDGDPRNEVVVTFFATEPATLIAERGDETSLMFQVAAASGTRYEGRNESLWEHQGESTVVWGYEATPMRCAPKG